MQRITISIDDDLLDVLDQLSASRGYTSRSEALREIVREMHAQEELAGRGDAPCVAALSYVYEHETRDLARRLTSAQHDHHALSIATLHVHLDHEECLEVAVLKGTVGQVRALGSSMIAQRGVRLGHLHVIPVAPSRHGAGYRPGHAHPHPHPHPHPPAAQARRRGRTKA